jgi:hypothetical protein
MGKIGMVAAFLCLALPESYGEVPSYSLASASLPFFVTTMSMSLAYADEAIMIRRLAPLTERDIARATGAGVSTVRA